MCVIAIKPKGASFPSTDIISACMQRNRDGFAVVWNEDGHLHNFKSMDPDKMLKKYIELATRLDPVKSAVIFHARIATHGSKNVKNCHCWIKNGIGFAHNGVLSNIPVNDDRTDSETFFADYFIPCMKGGGWELAEKICRLAIGYSSKFAFIDKNGDIRMIGSFIQDKEKGAEGLCYYSNSSYLPPKPMPDFRRSYTYPRGNYLTPKKSTKKKQEEKTIDDLDIFSSAMQPTTDRDWDFQI